MGASESKFIKFATFNNRVVFIGFGSIGQGTLPMLLRHLKMSPSQVTIITADNRGREIADKYDVKFIVIPITVENYREVLTPMLGEGDFCVNLSVDVSSVAVMELCYEQGALYLDTCIEPWEGGYTDASLSMSERSNYALREEALEFARNHPNGPTAVICHGANPGLISHFAKAALLEMAKRVDTVNGAPQAPMPTNRKEWAALAQRLGIKVMHVAERDTQVSKVPKARDEFVNTWSIDGFVSEGQQPAELGWGTHEKALPADGARHEFGCNSAIYLNRPGMTVNVRTWTPMEGPYQGFLITHNEAISMADYFTLKDDDNKVTYRPTVHYAYHPCDAAVQSIREMSGKNFVQQSKQRLIRDDILSGGVDELGILLGGNEHGCFWYGSQLTIDEARKLAPHNSATALQVTSSVLSAIIWALENPRRGVVEPEDLDHVRCLEIASPYLGPVVGVWSDWTPLQHRSPLFKEDTDVSDPWQFKNVRV
jgi:homospermidine synthase